MKKRFLLVRFLPTAGILGERGEERRKFVAGVRECEMLPHLPRIPLEVTLKKFQLDTRHELATNVQLDRGARPGLDTFTLPVSVCTVYIHERRDERASPRGGLERRKGRDARVGDRLLNIQRKFLGRNDTESTRERSSRECEKVVGFRSIRRDRIVSQ